jgi:hypothetical protein
VETRKKLWWFLMLRLGELIETVFFVLRKKQSQVSALHIYHHISTATLLWLYFKYNAGEIEKILWWSQQMFQIFFFQA